MGKVKLQSSDGGRGVGVVNSGVGSLKVTQVCVLEKQVDLGSDEQGGREDCSCGARQG